MNPNESLQTFCIANEMAQQLLDTLAHAHTRAPTTPKLVQFLFHLLYISLLVFLIFWLALFELGPQQRAYFEGESTRESICIVVVVVHSSTIESLKSLIGIGSIEEIHMFVCTDLYAYVPG